MVAFSTILTPAEQERSEHSIISEALPTISQTKSNLFVSGSSSSLKPIWTIEIEIIKTKRIIHILKRQPHIFVSKVYNQVRSFNLAYISSYEPNIKKYTIKEFTAIIV